MHSRKVTIDGDTVTLDFGHEGVLYKNSFIMYDKRTNTKWNHSTGLAMSGPLTGTELNTLPSRMMRWGEWKTQHPNTKVLVGQKREGFMGSYMVEDGAGILGLSVGMGRTPVLYRFALLNDKLVINDTVGIHEIVVTYDTRTQQAQVFRRTVNNKTLTFEPRSTRNDRLTMRDHETGTTWDAISGKALEGPLKGQKLESTVGVTWRIDRWRDIYPDGKVYR